MSDAEQIQVQEVSSTSESNGGDRTFLVKIRGRGIAPKEGENLLENARLLLKNGDYLLARNLFSFVLRKDLKNEKAMEGLGQCFLKLKEVVAAKKCFKALWEMYRKNTYAIHLGLCFLTDNDETGALSLFEQVTDSDEVEPHIRFEFLKAYGNLLVKRDKYSEAENNYQKALLIVPTSSLLHINLGMLELQRGQLRIAKSYFLKAIELEKNNSKAYGGLGLVCLQLNDMSGALEAFEKALDFDPKNTLALKQLIFLTDQVQSEDRVVRRIEAFLEKDPGNGEIRFQYARMLMQAKQFSRALEQVERVIRILPNDVRVLELRKILIQNRHRGAL